MLGEAGLLLLAVLGISFSAPLAAAAVVPSLAIAFWRTAMASAVLAPVVGARPARRRVGARDARTCAVAGVLLAVHFGTWTPSLVLTSVATSTALVCTAPLWTAVLDPDARRAGRAGRVGGRGGGAGRVCCSSPGSTSRARRAPCSATRSPCSAGWRWRATSLVGAAARPGSTTSTYTLLCYATAALVLLAVVLVAGVPLARLARGRVAVARRDHALRAVPRALAAQPRPAHRRARRSSPSSRCSRCPGAALVAALWLGERLAPATLAGLVVLLGGVALVVRGSRRA